MHAGLLIICAMRSAPMRYLTIIKGLTPSLCRDLCCLSLVRRETSSNRPSPPMHARTCTSTKDYRHADCHPKPPRNSGQSRWLLCGILDPRAMEITSQTAPRSSHTLSYRYQRRHPQDARAKKSMDLPNMQDWPWLLWTQYGTRELRTMRVWSSRRDSRSPLTYVISMIPLDEMH